ncbi:MAG TPA: glycosyltransferase [Pyrinomonadaceae bacterium]|nr:glycosyltransferase [Pyrinomonadaceae bacterium]
MRVSIIGPAYPLRGGISHHVYYLKRELTAQGHLVQVVSFSKLYPTLLFPGSTEFDTSTSGLDAKGEAILRTLNPLTWLRAFKAVTAFAPDVVIFQWWHSFFAPVIGTLARAFRKKGIKCVLECHNVFSHERTFLDAPLLTFAARPISSFITHSNKDRADLLTVVYGKNINVCPLPVPDEFSGGFDNNRSGHTLLFFGTVRKYKGLEVLLAALPKVLAQTECQLLIVGEFYEPEEKYRQAIRDYGIEQHVQIDNRYVPNEEISSIFDQADALVLPYLNATQSAVARIALSNGLPLIASRTGGLAEIVVENVNGLLFPAGDADALANQIVDFFTRKLGPEFSRNIQASSPVDSLRSIAGTLDRIVAG